RADGRQPHRPRPVATGGPANNVRECRIRTVRVAAACSRSTRATAREASMSNEQPLFPRATREIAEERTRLAPGPAEGFKKFSEAVFADGALSTKTKQLIAVAVTHVTQCPYCIRGHTLAASRQGA